MVHYYLTVQSTTGGTANSSVGNNTVTATPDEGYNFSEWTIEYSDPAGSTLNDLHASTTGVSWIGYGSNRYLTVKAHFLKSSITKTIRFADNSKGLIASTDFDFGDGSAHATDLPVDHEYNINETGDTVNATLIVTDTKGNSDTITKTIDLS